jgi:anaerobic selenocysteine-containing dehydrogenase
LRRKKKIGNSEKMSEKKNESIADKKISRRSMLKWTAGLAVAGAVGIGVGYEVSQLLTPAPPAPPTPPPETVSATVPDVYWEEEGAFPAGSHSHGSGPAEVNRVHVKNGKVFYVEPLNITADEANSLWSITAGGKTFSRGAFPRTANSAMGLAYRSRLADPTRVRYPLKRVDFTAGGTSDVTTRGKGDFVRITWDEAFDTVASEIKRIKAKYGNPALWMYYSPHVDSQLTNGNAAFQKMRVMIGGITEPNPGGFTERIFEGWTWSTWTLAGSSVWGYTGSHGLAPETDYLPDTMQNAKLLVFWGTDPTTVSLPYGGQECARWRQWIKELGIRMVSINPLYTDTAAVYCDQWIPIIPGTDVAMALAIANVWIKEGTYDKDYVATHTVGFDKFSDYVLGKAEGPDGKIDRTPEWASQKTGIPADTITALAREWGSKTTSLAVYESGSCRTSYGHEWGRMMILLQAMQGLGKPGVNIWHAGVKGNPFPQGKRAKGFANMTTAGVTKFTTNWQSAKDGVPINPCKQVLHQLNTYDNAAIDWTKNPPMQWVGFTGEPYTFQTPKEIFTQQTYPSPGCSEVHLVWRNGGGGGYGMMGTDTASVGRAYQKPGKIEFLVVTSPRMECEAKFADIILPCCQIGETNDAGSNSQMGSMIVYTPKLVEPLGETLPDYDICAGVLDRLGLKADFTEGNTYEDFLRKMYEASDCPLSWEEFKAKGYYIFPWKEAPLAPAWKWYYDKPQGEGLQTPSGKLEFYSGLLAEHYGADSMWCTPKYYDSPHGRYSPAIKKYPIQVVTPHSRYRCHSKNRNTPFLQNLRTFQGDVINGYNTASMNPADANARGIKEGDIVRLYNDTGQILCYAHLTERVRQGVSSVPWGSWWDPSEPGNCDSVDKGGCCNVLLSRWTDATGVKYDVGNPNGGPAVEGRFTNSPIWFGNHGHSILVEMEKWTGA